MSSFETCASHSSCGNCTEWGCIWCGDEIGCHAQFSPYGCIHAEPCDSVFHCKRKHPQPLSHHQYAHINGTATVITLSLLMLFLIGCYFIMRLVVKYRKKRLKIKRHLRGDVELQRYLNEPYRVLPNQTDHHPQVLPFQSSEGFNYMMSDSVINIRELRRDLVPAIDYRKDKYVKCTGCILQLCSALAISVSVMVIVLFPTIPVYYVCDTETDWNRIWSAMEHLSPQNNFDVLFTIKNNNYFSTELSNIGIRIYYNNEIIGHWYSNQEQEKEEEGDGKESGDEDLSRMYIPHHSMTDLLIPISMDYSLFKSYNLWQLYQDDNLPLEIDFFADTSTYFLSKDRDWKLLDYHLNLQIRDYVVGINIPTDRTGCNCPAKPLSNTIIISNA